MVLLGVNLLLQFWEDIFKIKLSISQEVSAGMLLTNGFFLTIQAGISISQEKMVINVIGALVLAASMILISGFSIYKAGHRAGKKEGEK